ncbi:hypothetical protein ACQPZG_05220 (plasmid) [Streptomyces sp. CA-294286]|uniref:hypothetical protein n=1 Tax=Streptomyces sp. CA-294286 TaxID=3240070 RepID=UPI003D947D7B
MALQTDPASESDWTGLVAELAMVRADRLGKRPSDRLLGTAAGVSPTTVGDWLRGERFPQRLELMLILVREIRAHAERTGGADTEAALFDLDRWRIAYRAEARRRSGDTRTAALAAQAQAALARGRPGRLLTELASQAAAFDLEVHRALLPEEGGGDALTVLPPYLPRAHDRVLADVVESTAGGTSALAVLVGGSSTGKTRALWEALALLREQPVEWRLWHPLAPSRPEALLAGVPDVGSHTVVWLNEAQEYLSDPVLGERVAASLRALMRDTDRLPVLVLATLWPEHWQRLTARRDPDAHAQARALLAEGVRVRVPDSFTAADASVLAVAETDSRLRRARARAVNGEITQYLAGVPVLLQRYEDARADARALLDAAIDGRRLGWGMDLPAAFLADAASGYLSAAEWDQYGERWPAPALQDTDEHRGGFRGPLTRVRRRPQPGEPASVDPPVYRLADSLEEHGRRSRAYTFPAETFWTASMVHADPFTMIALAEGARVRGLYRTQACLLATAAQSNATAAAELVAALTIFVVGARDEASRWAAGVVPLTDPGPLGLFLGFLRGKVQKEAIAVLLTRGLGRQAEIDDHFGVAHLVDQLHECARYPGFPEPVRAAAAAELATLLNRHPDWNFDIDDPKSITEFADTLRGSGTDAPAAQRLLEYQAGTDPGDADGEDAPTAAAALASRLRELVEAQDDQALVGLLAEQPARQVPITDADGVARLLHQLRWLTVFHTVDEVRRLARSEGATLLVERRPWERVSLTDSAGVALLLRWLDHNSSHWTNYPDWFLHKLEQCQEPLYLHLRDQPHRDAEHLAWLWEKAMLGRLATRAAEVALTNVRGVASLLSILSENTFNCSPGVAEAAVARLLERNPAHHVPPVGPDNDRYAAEELIDALRDANDAEAASHLEQRAFAAGAYTVIMRGEHQDYGLLPDGTRSPAWSWSDVIRDLLPRR